MAKINHHNFVDTINDVLAEAKRRGVMRLEFNDEEWRGDRLKVNNKNMVNFGTCGYMGLENHQRIIDKAVEYTHKYGVQFSVSRTYLTDSKSYILEDLLEKVFLNNPVITFTSTSIAHTSVLPIVVGHNDAIILDQQAHISIQTAAQLMVPKGVPIDIVRHSNLEMLEHKIKQLRNKHDKIWYMIDGVYSMYGDVAPINEINELMQKYEQLHLYVDDAHGMSWYGNNGCGRIFKEANENQKTIYITTMAKGYGAMGGIAVFPNKEWYQKVILHGGPLSYSHPVPPPMLGAAIGSAEIHLSDEINQIQESLKSKLEYTSSLLEKTNIPVLSNPGTPIFYVGTGQPIVGYNLNKRILDEGFYVTIGIFPGVPVKNTGLRFTVTDHNNKQQIKDFIEAIEYHYPKALESEGKTVNDVRKAFRLPLLEEKEKKSDSSNLKVVLKRTISDVDKELWDACFKDKGNFDWEALQTMEKAFSGNDLPEENWEFYYLMVFDVDDKLLLATYFTSGLFKDDLLSKQEVSFKVEEKRKSDPYYLVSKSVIMGSLFTEGDHMYVDKTNDTWRGAVNLMLDAMFEVQDKEDANGIILRDFHGEEKELEKMFHDSGFFKIQMPNTNIVTDLNHDVEVYYNNLSQKSRKHMRDDVFRFTDKFKIEIKDELNSDEQKMSYQLYENVEATNFALNIFKYPRKAYQEMSNNKNWEFVCLVAGDKTVAVGCCYVTENAYFPVLLGMDYELNKEIKVYKQMLFQVVKRAIELKKSKVHFGLSADLEKRKMGAKTIPKFAFTYVRDNYNFEVLESMSASN